MYIKRFAIIGCNSFAGAGFVAAILGYGAEVLGVSRSQEPPDIFLPYKQLPYKQNFTFCRADLNKNLDNLKNALDSFRPQVVVDFAAQSMVAESWATPEHWYTTNIVAKVKLHDYLRTCLWLEKYIRISTPEVYGSHNQLLKETWEFHPSTPYAVSQAACDMSLKAYHSQYGFPVIFTRFANFYGPCQQLYRIIPKTIIYALTQKKLALHGGGHSIRSFIYINDTTDGILKVIDKGIYGEIYHFSPKKFYSIREVVELICAKLSVRFEDFVEEVVDRPGKDKAYLMDSTKVQKELGWSATIDLSQGIDQTIHWVTKNRNRIVDLPLEYIHKE